MNLLKHIALILVVGVAGFFIIHNTESPEVLVAPVVEEAPIALHNKGTKKLDLVSTVTGNPDITILSHKDDELRLLNSSGKDIIFDMPTWDTVVKVTVPKDTKFHIYGNWVEDGVSVVYGVPQEGKISYATLTEELPNGVFVEFRGLVDGPWDECSYESTNCDIVDLKISKVDFAAWTSKESGKLLSIWSTNNVIGLDGIRIYTSDGRQLIDEDRVNIAKALVEIDSKPYRQGEY